MHECECDGDLGVGIDDSGAAETRDSRELKGHEVELLLVFGSGLSSGGKNYC